MKVFLSDDKSSFTMQGRIWTQTIKIEDLRKQIDLYTRLTKRRGGEFARNYQPSLNALKALAKDVSA